MFVVAHPLAVGLVFGVALIGTILLCEVGARLYLGNLPGPKLPAAIVAEYGRLHVRMSAGGYWLYDDFAGQYMTVENGYRRTVSQPAHYRHTLWLFGNSSTFDVYVSDADTLASRLQGLLHGLRVVNAGMTGALASGELARLRDVPLVSGDMVVFLDGALDEGVGRQHCDAANRFSSWALYKVACDRLNAILPPDTSWRERYAATLDQASRYAASKGAAFAHFEQPSRDAGYVEDMPARLRVPDETFLDSTHLNAAGDALVAAALYRALVTL